VYRNSIRSQESISISRGGYFIEIHFNNEKNIICASFSSPRLKVVHQTFIATEKSSMIFRGYFIQVDFPDGT
jgi:hypothetical protein